MTLGLSLMTLGLNLTTSGLSSVALGLSSVFHHTWGRVTQAIEVQTDSINSLNHQHLHFMQYCANRLIVF